MTSLGCRKGLWAMTSSRKIIFPDSGREAFVAPVLRNVRNEHIVFHESPSSGEMQRVESEFGRRLWAVNATECGCSSWLFIQCY